MSGTLGGNKLLEVAREVAKIPLKLTLEGVNPTRLTTYLPDFPESGPLALTRLNDVPTKLGRTDIYELSIGGKCVPDVAYIVARESSQVQRIKPSPEKLVVEGGVRVSEIFIGTNNDAPVGIVLMDPEGNVTTSIYDPLNPQGLAGYTLTEGWTAQIILGEGTELRFLDYWWPIGFSYSLHQNRNSKALPRIHGELVEEEVLEKDVPEQFSVARDNLKTKIDALTNERNLKLDEARRTALVSMEIPTVFPI